MNNAADPKIRLLADVQEFWAYADVSQRSEVTPAGSAQDAEERRDLRAAQVVKELLESLLGPEEGDSAVQCQNWDWNDDATRPVFVLSSAFRWSVVAALRGLLLGELADYRVVVMLQDSWQSEIWGGLVITESEVAVQRAVAGRYQKVS